MNASTVAAVISVLADEPWMPRVSHWEIATTDETWGAHAELDCKTSGPASRELHALAERVDSKVAEISDNLTAVDFVHDEVPVRVWWLRPALRWVVPATCATCPTKLRGEPGAKFVRLGEGDREAPVICVPCRDRMHAEFVAAAERDGEDPPFTEAAAAFMQICNTPALAGLRAELRIEGYAPLVGRYCGAGIRRANHQPGVSLIEPILGFAYADSAEAGERA